MCALALSFAIPEGQAQSPMYLYERVDVELWTPSIGDRFLVDTESNIGYLVHTNGRYIQFDVATGQRRYVSYIGRYYFAATPTWEWTAKTNETKWDRTTYGKDGTFLRLFRNGDERTAYGIHAYKNDGMHETEDRFRSMGCIVPTHKMLDVIVETMNVNEGEIRVTTQFGIEQNLFVMR